MSGERVYPEAPAGSFPSPPVAFEDREGRTIEVRGYPPGTAAPEAVVEMYVAFDPADRAQGIPPTGEDAVRRWLETIFEAGYNAVAWHGEEAAGHATLVPEGGGKATDRDATGHTAVGGDGATDADAPASRDGTTAGDPPAAGTGADVGVGPGAESGPYELAIFVLQSYQRAGIGTRLLEGLLGYGAANGVERVWLSVERWNRAAVALYENVGFEVSGDGNFELEMALRLDG